MYRYVSKEGQEKREKLKLLSILLLFFIYISAHSTIEPSLSTIMVELKGGYFYG